MKSKTSLMGEVFLRTVCKVLDDHKALDIAVIDLVGKSSFADHMIIASGTSQRHLLALGDYVEATAHKAGHAYVRIEGKENGADWILVDLGHVIVHLFRPETRQLYDLESMWNSPLLTARQG